MTDKELDALMRATGTEGSPKDVRKLAEAVQAAERKRCIRICKEVAWLNKNSATFSACGVSEGEQCAKAIE